MKGAAHPEDLRLHDARHFAASIMLTMTEHFTLEQVQKVGGWKNATMLLTTYAELDEKFTEEPLAEFGKRLASRRTSARAAKTPRKSRSKTAQDPAAIT